MTLEKKFNSKSTVILCWLAAAIGGLMFGYHIGNPGGMIAMDDSSLKFFPDVYEKKQGAKQHDYCKFNSQLVQLFTSSLYIAAFVSSFLASWICSKCGSVTGMLVASLCYFIGASLNFAAPVLLPQLIIGRVILGFGVGVGNVAVPLFLYEIVPANYRGLVNILFQFFVTIGILCANLMNYFLSDLHPSGLLLPSCLAMVLAAMFIVGSSNIPCTPTLLIKDDHLLNGRRTLEHIRRTDNVNDEFNEILVACQLAHQVKNPFKKLTEPSSQPPLVIAILVQVLQQLTGINAIMFYAPFIFRTVGFKTNASFLLSVIVGLIAVISTSVSITIVDKFGRKVLLLQACCQMFITQIILGEIHYFHLKAANSLGGGETMLVCLYVMSFAWSWGSLGWLIPSEMFPLETRTAAYTIAVSSNMICTFIMAQAFLSMICYMGVGIFFFFTAWIVVMGLFVVFFVPETKNIPINEMDEKVWKQHWFWSRYMVE